MEHFVLSHSKGVPVGRPAEGSVTLLAILVSAVAVVRMGKVCATICTLVASVCNTNVIIQESSISIKRRNVIQLQLVNSKSFIEQILNCALPRILVRNFDRPKLHFPRSLV
jgi:hypothetical protein